MAEKFLFSLVSPERELFHGEVEHVVAPGAEGEFGVLARHAPFMATLKPGTLRILGGGAERSFFVNGGFADVTPAGLTVLSEDAVDLASVEAAAVEADLANVRAAFSAAAEGEIGPLAARLARLEALHAALR